MDRRVGNTKKMGALFGILAAIGGPIPEPETIPYAFFILSNRLSAIFKSELLVVAYACWHLSFTYRVLHQQHIYMLIAESLLVYWVNMASCVNATTCCMCALHVALAVNPCVSCHSLYVLLVVSDIIFRCVQCAFC